MFVTVYASRLDNRDVTICIRYVRLYFITVSFSNKCGVCPPECRAGRPCKIMQFRLFTDDIFRIMEVIKVETDITAYPSRAPEFTTIFGGVRVVHLFSFFRCLITFFCM